MEIISLPGKGFLRGVFLANHLAINYINQNNQEREHMQMQTNGTQKVALINSNTLKKKLC